MRAGERWVGLTVAVGAIGACGRFGFDPDRVVDDVDDAPLPADAPRLVDAAVAPPPDAGPSTVVRAFRPTGTADDGSALPYGVADDAYALVAAANGGSTTWVVDSAGYWGPPPATGRWVSYAKRGTSPGSSVPGSYVFETMLDASGLDVAAPGLTLVVETIADEQLVIELNGALLLASQEGAVAWTPSHYEFPADALVAGPNTLTFRVDDSFVVGGLVVSRLELVAP